MLGQVLLESADQASALREFQEAVRLDPKYLDAWSAIVDLGRKGALSPPDLQQAAFAFLELDPLGQHGSYRARECISDYAALWRMYAKVDASLPRIEREALYPLHKQAKQANPMSIGF